MAAELRAYVTAHAGVPFHWRDCNCLTFVQGALRAAGRAGLPDDWCLPAKDRREALRLYRAGLRADGAASIAEGMDARFERVFTLHPGDGLVCARQTRDVLGVGFGVTLGQGCVFLTDAGARWFDVEPGDMFWSVE
jgi:hypothetical protein